MTFSSSFPSLLFPPTGTNPFEPNCCRAAFTDSDQSLAAFESLRLALKLLRLRVFFFLGFVQGGVLLLGVLFLGDFRATTFGDPFLFAALNFRIDLRICLRMDAICLTLDFFAKVYTDVKTHESRCFMHTGTSCFNSGNLEAQ